ncbi:MAG: cation:proton antiporter [Gammaproteobacteria bacterium]|nr:cation:proton antiporter [Gammaproteobacteria bacterium]
MEQHSIFLDILILMALSVIAVATLRRFNLSPIIGYLFVGVISGPYALGWLPEGDAIHLMAEIGVVFLLFTIGLEFSISQLVAMRTAVLGLGGAQVIISVTVGGIIAYFTGISWEASLIIGAILALSSTALVGKQLNEQLEMQSRHGRLSISVLLFQDIAVVPFLIIIPILASDGSQNISVALLIALAKGALAFAIMYGVGRYALRPVFHAVSAAKSSELFTLTTLLIALTAAAATASLGLSLALGAFLAGMMLGETEYRHQIEAEIRPFRDILMGLFFISVGGLLSITSVLEHWLWISLIVVGLIFIKGLLVALLVRAMGYENGVAFRTALVLAHGSEFGFALLTLSLQQNLLTNDESQPILAALILSMALAPILIRYNGKLAKWLFRNSYLKGRQLKTTRISHACSDLSDHVILCGFGRIGQNLASFLKEENIAYVGFDTNPSVIKETWEAGESVYFGDATHHDMLSAAGIKRAKALVITFDDFHTATRIVESVRRHHNDIPIIVRTRHDEHLESLEQAGASEVIPDALEASMMLASHLLRLLDIDEDEVKRLVKNARSNKYQRLRQVFSGDKLNAIEDASRERKHTVVLPPGSHAIGHKIAKLNLLTDQLSLNTVRRGREKFTPPNPDMVLQAGDALVLQGSSEALDQAEKTLLRG